MGRGIALAVAVMLAAGPAAAQGYHAVPGGTAGCADAGIAAVVPDMLRLLGEDNVEGQASWLRLGGCVPAEPDTAWRLLRTDGEVALMVRDGGTGEPLYFAGSAMVDAGGRHPGTRGDGPRAADAAISGTIVQGFGPRRPAAARAVLVQGYNGSLGCFAVGDDGRVLPTAPDADTDAEAMGRCRSALQRRAAGR